MRALSRTTIAVLLAAVWVQALADAQGPAPALASASRSVSSAARGSTAARGTAVFGFVWNADNEPIAFANVRLRNVSSGRVDATAVAAESGEFTFENLEGGTYVIEYVDEKGKVLAVGHVFSVAPGETVATFIRLARRSSWYATFFGSGHNIAATAIASAASLGLTALAPASRPVSPEF